MNLIQASVASGRLVIEEAPPFPLPARIANKLHAGQRLIVGIRPEAARIDDQGHGAGSAGGLVLRGVIDVVEPDFGRRQQTAYVSVGKLAFSITTSQEVRLTPGYEVQVQFPEEALYFFDAESEARIRVD